MKKKRFAVIKIAEKKDFRIISVNSEAMGYI